MIVPFGWQVRNAAVALVNMLPGLVTVGLLAVGAPLADAPALRPLVETVHPALELPDLRFEPGGSLRAIDLVADGVGAHRFVLGAGRPVDGLDLSSLAAVLERDGIEVARGTGRDALGDPWRALLWLSRDLVSRGQSLEPGDIVLSGALGPVQVHAPAAAAGRYRARLTGLGEVSVSIAAP